VADVERAFAEVWAMMGKPIPDDELTGIMASSPAGDVTLRIVAVGARGLDEFKYRELARQL
jgi:cardiolipin synthase A/B